MYTEEILNIAKFMGITPIKGISEHTGNVYYYYNNHEAKDYEGLPFYDEWNEIIPVVEKIEKIGGGDNEFDIFGNCVQLGSSEFIGKSKKEAILKAINWWIKNNNI